MALDRLLRRAHAAPDGVARHLLHALGRGELLAGLGRRLLSGLPFLLKGCLGLHVLLPVVFGAALLVALLGLRMGMAVAHLAACPLALERQPLVLVRLLLLPGGVAGAGHGGGLDADGLGHCDFLAPGR